MGASFDRGTTLLGAGPWREEDLARALDHAPHLVCADGAANALAARRPDLTPDMIIGDLDSLEGRDRWAARLGDGLVPVAEQDSTDFEKCLDRISAPLIIGVGFTGGRIDHELAALNALAFRRRPVALIAEADVIFAACGEMSAPSSPGERVSLFPLCPVAARSEGLRWPLDGLALAPGGAISTSNEAVADRITVTVEGPGALLILPKARLAEALAAIRAVYDETGAGGD